MAFNRAITIAFVTLIPALAHAEPAVLQGACKNDAKMMCGGAQPG